MPEVADEPCPECGEEMTFCETALPGGGGYFEYNCESCDYHYSDGF